MPCVLSEVLHLSFVDSGEPVLRNGRFPYVTANVVNNDSLGDFATDENVPTPSAFDFKNLHEFAGL